MTLGLSSFIYLFIYSFHETIHLQGVPNQQSMIVIITHTEYPFYVSSVWLSLKYKTLFCLFANLFSLLLIANLHAVFNWLRDNIMASNYSQLHLATISDANWIILKWFIVVKTVKDGPKKNRQTNYDSYICPLTNDHLLFIDFVIKFQISANITFELRPRQRTDYRSLHSGENNLIW